MTEFDSLHFFVSHKLGRKLLGSSNTEMPHYRLYLIYSILMNLMVTVLYPVHLGLALFQDEDTANNLKNLTIFFACISSSLKFFSCSYRIGKVDRIEHLLQLLDARISGPKQLEICRGMKRHGRLLIVVYACIYFSLGIFIELSFLFQGERQLMYPARLPFDWGKSTRNYYLANAYQFVGIYFFLLQNYVNDCYPAVMMCLVSAHIRMLYVRLEQVAVDTAVSDDAHEQELELCITDHKHLLQLFETTESFISFSMLIQFAVTGINLCIGVAALLFFATDPMAYMYFAFYSIGVPWQILPTCYYGTDNELSFSQLHYAAFSCNWTTQKRSFKQKLMLFVERSLKRTTAMAAGMVRIHMDTFFTTVKFAYSLFAFILSMRK